MGTSATRWWHGGLAALVTFALTGQTVLVVDHDGSVLNMVSYFTIESNLLVLVASVLIAVYPARSAPGWRTLRLAALTGITVTGVVYTALIAPHTNPTGLARWYDVIFHYVVPLATVLGFALLGPRDNFEHRDIAFMAWPAVWLAYTLVRGAISEPAFETGTDGTPINYPYEFVDPDEIGYPSVAAHIAGITVLLIATALCYIWASRRLIRWQATGGPAGP